MRAVLINIMRSNMESLRSNAALDHGVQERRSGSSFGRTRVLSVSRIVSHEYVVCMYDVPAP